jgi:DNA-directed RNA polymerase specialized sigma24 family protein
MNDPRRTPEALFSDCLREGVAPRAASDAAQDVLLRVLEGRLECDSVETFQRLVRNRLRTAARSEARRSATMRKVASLRRTIDPSPEALAAAKETAEAVAEGLRRLPSLHREALDRRHLRGESSKAVATALFGSTSRAAVAAVSRLVAAAVRESRSAYANEGTPPSIDERAMIATALAASTAASCSATRRDEA